MSNNTELISINNNLLKRQDGEVLGAPPFPGMGSFRLKLIENYPPGGYGIIFIKLIPKCDFNLASWEIADASSSLETPERLIGSGFILNDTIEGPDHLSQHIHNFTYATFNTVTLTKIADQVGGLWDHDNYLVRYSRSLGPVLLEAGKTYYLNVSGPMHDSIVFPIGYNPAKTLTGFEYQWLPVVPEGIPNNVFNANSVIVGDGHLENRNYTITRPYLKLVDSQGRVIYS